LKNKERAGFKLQKISGPLENCIFSSQSTGWREDKDRQPLASDDAVLLRSEIGQSRNAIDFRKCEKESLRESCSSCMSKMNLDLVVHALQPLGEREMAQMLSRGGEDAV
jgi:hypothetical protein